MKLSMIICMKQWDKQGQEGSRCKLSRNLCSECYFSSGCCGECGGVGTAPGMAPARLRGGSLTLNHQLISLAERRVPAEINTCQWYGLVLVVPGISLPVGWQKGPVLLMEPGKAGLCPRVRGCQAAESQLCRGAPRHLLPTLHPISARACFCFPFFSLIGN